MPRVENIGSNVNLWYNNPGNGNGSSTFDICKQCADELKSDPHAFDDKLKPYNGDPPGDEGREGDCDHPLYQDEDYGCEVCKKSLTEEDN